ncbi:MAG: hypothetical protein VCA55_07320 [Verrucomicrobiales bacterium]
MTIPFPPSFQFTSCLCRAVLPSALFVLVLNFHSRADELPGAAGDELPPGLELIISNPAIPIIVDATITNFTKEGHAEIKVNKIYKAPKASAGKKIAVPEKVRGYLMDGVNPRVVPIKIITDKGKKRFLFFLKGDLLYSTYNNRFEIKEDKTGKLIVHTGRKWQPLADTVKLIPGKVHAHRSCGTRDPSALNGY